MTDEARRTDGARAIDRQLGWLMSLGGAVLIFGQTLPLLSQVPSFALWWNVGAVGVAAVIVLSALLGRILPFPVIRAGWIAAPSALAALGLLTFLAYQGPDAGTLLPWAWTLEPSVLAFLVLWLRPLTALAAAMVSALLPAASGLIFLGSVPSVVAAATPLHLSNMVFVVIFAGIRGRLLQLHSDELDAQQLQLRRERAVQDAAQRQRVGVIVHDEVLSVMNAAAALTGHPPDALRREAAHALAVLDAPPMSEPGSVDAERLVRQLCELAQGIDPSCKVDLISDGGEIPRIVVTAVVGAVEEALHNSIRHAGDARRRVSVRAGGGRVRVEVGDDGVGFDPLAVAPERLGVRGSIRARMRAIPGGDGTVRSAPGAGTVVVVTWSA